jgi:hypothetical protein
MFFQILSKKCCTNVGAASLSKQCFSIEWITNMALLQCQYHSWVEHMTSWSNFHPNQFLYLPVSSFLTLVKRQRHKEHAQVTTKLRSIFDKVISNTIYVRVSVYRRTNNTDSCVQCVCMFSMSFHSTFVAIFPPWIYIAHTSSVLPAQLWN